MTTNTLPELDRIEQLAVAAHAEGHSYCVGDDVCDCAGCTFDREDPAGVAVRLVNRVRAAEMLLASLKDELDPITRANVTNYLASADGVLRDRRSL
ncbi:MAG TPA: hypothetical protein VFK80_02375 [Limnochordia bacterium]|nr:hypothetical protein [Limnochordia bacterium]